MAKKKRSKSRARARSGCGVVAAEPAPAEPFNFSGIYRLLADQKSDLPAELKLLRVLPSAQAAPFCGYSVDHFHELHRAGLVPPAIKLSARKYGWRVADLIDWLRSRSPVEQASA